MDSKARKTSDGKAEFRKPSTDATNRKYRRKSSVDRSSSSSDGSPHHDRSSNPVSSRKDIAKTDYDKQKKDDRSQSGRSGESYKHSERPPSRSYHMHDDYRRRDKHLDDYDRGYSKSSYRSNRDSRDYSRADVDHHSRDYANDSDPRHWTRSEGAAHKTRDKDSYDRAGSGRKHKHANIEERDKDRDRHRDDRSDRYGKTDHRKSSWGNKINHSPTYEDSRGERNNASRRDDSGPRLKETSKRDAKELDGEGYSNDENQRIDDVEVYKDPDNKEPKEQSDGLSIKNEDSVAKKPKFCNLDNMHPDPDGSSEQACVTDSDIDAAKIAAMRAAELVNRNLVGTGYMSTDQKKKLLWGNKKNTATQEPAHRWDTTTFGDRERQEKFNKLMSLKLHWYLWPIVGREGRCESRAEDRQPRCGETTRAAADGTREAVHSWIAAERWSNCWTRSVKLILRYSHDSILVQTYCIA